jgi:hypothetical protein
MMLLQSTRPRRTAATVVLATLAGTVLSLLSTFVGQRSASAIYPDIMGCEAGCRVAASGWPLVFVRDYLGMSVHNTADMFEVWFAADRFDWIPFLLNVAFWSVTCFAAILLLGRRGRG